MDIKRRSPKIPGNGCPCMCCGRGPPPIDAAKILEAGGKFVQLPDGRVVEYYVYGSARQDARIFLQINGSNGSGRIYHLMPPIVKVLRDRNVRGISISVPGHGLSTNHPFRKIGEWPKDDVEPVLKAEGVPENSPLIVEGTSFGSSHAMAVMHHFGERITHAHLHVPYLPLEVRRDYLEQDPVDPDNYKGWKENSQGDGLKCGPTYLQRCFLIPGHCCTPCLFCCCSMCFYCCCAASKAVAEDKPKNKEIGFEATYVQADDINHACSASIHGFIYNAFVPTVSSNWGFDPRQINDEHVRKMKVAVSYGKDDVHSPEEHGRFLADFYSKKCNKDGKLNGDPNEYNGKCVVNFADGGHGAHHVRFCTGKLLEELLSM